MESDLATALLGLKLIAVQIQTENRSNATKSVSSTRSYFRDNNKGRSSRIVVDCHDEPDDNNNESLTIDQSQDLLKSVGCSVNTVKKCWPSRGTETVTKKPRLDNSRNKENKENEETSAAALRPLRPINNNKPETRSTSSSKNFRIGADSGFNETKKSSSLEQETESNRLNKEHSRFKDNDGSPQRFCLSPNDRHETQTSGSTYFSDAEKNYFPPTSSRSPNTASNDCDTVEIINIDYLEYYISLLLGVLENDQLTLEYITLLKWQNTIAKEAVDTFVLIADSTQAKDAARLCRTAAINSIEKVYARYLKELYSRELDMDDRWYTHFGILFTMCNSRSICREFLKWLTNHLITPRIVKDLEDPKEIIDVFVQHDEAQFVLTLIHTILKKYAPTTEEKYYADLSLDFEKTPENWGYFQEEDNIMYVHLLTVLDEYAKNCFNFPALTSIATAMIAILRSKLPWQKLL